MTWLPVIVWSVTADLLKGESVRFFPLLANAYNDHHCGASSESFNSYMEEITIQL